MKHIYLDHAATAPTDPRVVEAMRPYFTEVYANPSSFHSFGLAAKRAVHDARERIAAHLRCREDEILFTSGGTESDNLAVEGVIGAAKLPKAHIITSSIEHPAILEPLRRRGKEGTIDLTVLPADRYGLVLPEDVQKALRPETVLVSVMYANNEIGTIEPIADIGRVILGWRTAQASAYPYFHTDACQAAGYLSMDVQKLHVDLLTMNGSKIYGPKGIGVLFGKRGVKLRPMILGGGQEKNLRSGTENVPGIVGLARALDLSQDMSSLESERLAMLRDMLTEGLLRIPKSRLNGHPEKRLPNIVNISFLDIEGEAAILYMDAKGMCASTGSACASQSLDPSHVILATGLSYEAAHGSIRFSLGRSTTKKDIQYVIKMMPGIVEKLRHMSPVNLDMKHFVK